MVYSTFMLTGGKTFVVENAAFYSHLTLYSSLLFARKARRSVQHIF